MANINIERKTLYKYASSKAAIFILSDSFVKLTNPKDFNDPYDCYLFQDKKDKKKIDDLFMNYFFYEIYMNNIVNKSDDSSKKDNLANLYNKKMSSSFLKSLDEDRHFKGIPGFKLYLNILIKKHKELDTLVKERIEDFRKDVDKIIEKYKNDVLITCFSEVNNSTLMWSHYAANHKGVCLEFSEVLFHGKGDRFKKVKYQNKRPTIKMYSLMSHLLALLILNKFEYENVDKDELNLVLEPFFIKSKEWKYEKEVRAIYYKDEVGDLLQERKDGYYRYMGNIKAIYTGCEIEKEDLEIISKIAAKRKIPIHHMKKSIDSFKLIVED